MNQNHRESDKTLVNQRLLNASSLNTFKATIHGTVLTPNDEGYDQARLIWNRMIDKRPALIIKCSSTADVILATRFAKEHNLLISIKGGGHNIAGRALENDVLLIDLSDMKSVLVDPDKKIATIGPGATLADIDHATQIYALALPTGINSTTGIAGLTLGGGFGWLSRKYGMTIDHLLSAEVITVDGDRVVCNQKQHQDLFFAIRGGGGNFGIVTSFSFNLENVGPTIFSGPVIFSIDEAKHVYQGYIEFCKSASNKSTVWSVMRNCPPFPFVDAKYHGKPTLILVGMYAGEIEDGKRVLSKLKELGTPLGDALSPHKFTDFQKAFDPLLTPGFRNYWKTSNFKKLDDSLIDIVIDYAKKLPSPHCELFFAQVGGEINKIPKDATAYPHRDIEFIMNVHARWESDLHDQAAISWAKELSNAVKPYATGGAYINFVSEGDDSIENSFLDNNKKLARIKLKYDPKNVLRSNINIAPSSKT